MPDLGIDVTTAIQALVHNGQLFIPGERSKVHFFCLMFSFLEGCAVANLLHLHGTK